MFAGPPPSEAGGDSNTAEIEVVVAVDSNESVVGFAGFSGQGGTEGRLVTLYVAPECQGTGVGTALWEVVCSRLRERGCVAMQVWTLRRARAVDFYVARGAREVGAGSISVGEHVEPAVCLRLELG